MKLAATVKFSFIHLFQNDLMYHFKNVAKVSSSVSSSVELEYAIYVTMLCSEQFFAYNKYPYLPYIYGIYIY